MKTVTGIIPTRMGTRPSGISVDAKDEDHPHAYGDKFCLSNSALISSGSSPRVWGQVRSIRYFPDSVGIIPTRMGTSLQTCTKQAVNKDHPHAYGDKMSYDISPLRMLGSSPRVWGQDQFDNIDIDKTRIIPTRMGTSGSVCPSSVVI